jgi:hypothetical protein
VQPFVALARGLAELHGYLVTICTELRWKSFVLSNSKTTNGKIMFRPSGGDTEKYMGTYIARWATQTTSEIVQISMMAASEAFFFESTTVFLDHVMTFDGPGYQPVDLIMYGFTVAGIALTVGEYCKKPICGFILQPSCIPSTSKDWAAVVPIDTHNLLPAIDNLEKGLTSHAALGTLKKIFEENPFQEWNLSSIRKVLMLQPVNTWEKLKELDSPIVIPIHQNTFQKPSDWWNGIKLTDFIFLRSPPSPSSGAAYDFHEPLKSFLDEARRRSSKLCVVSFSSMQVPRARTLELCTRMVELCKFNLSVIYVGKRFDDTVKDEILSKAADLTTQGRFLELDQAPFDQLFKEMDCFVVHGGLGTTVEALRMKKPVAVTGPLLMDQRFWGGVVHKKGVGPEPHHVDVFKRVDKCVAFVDNALDPADPSGWQRNARELDFGADGSDGVQANADLVSQLVS